MVIDIIHANYFETGNFKTWRVHTQLWWVKNYVHEIRFTESFYFVFLQPVQNYNEWRIIYFISFLLLVGFFVLNMFVGVVVENFHKCRESQEKEEKARRAEKRAQKLDQKRRSRILFINCLTVNYIVMSCNGVRTPVVEWRAFAARSNLLFHINCIWIHVKILFLLQERK